MKNRVNISFISTVIIFLFIIYMKSFSGNYYEKLVFDGSENVVSYGIDTTGHWWIAAAGGFSQNYVVRGSIGQWYIYDSTHLGMIRIIIDGIQSKQYYEVTKPVFSPDGKRWAFFGHDNVKWNIVTNDTILPLFCDSVSLLGYSKNSEILYYSYSQGSETIFSIGEKTVRGYNSFGDIFVSYGGERYAIGGYRGDRKVYTLQGWETPPYDEIIPIGFLYDGSFLYAAKNGPYWEVFRDKKVISESFLDIVDYTINSDCNAAGILARRISGDNVAILLSDEYSEPLVSRPYDGVNSIIIHPTLPMIAYKAVSNGNNYIVLSNTEFIGGVSTGKPKFTHDGSQLYFYGCNVDCFINIDGRKYSLYNLIDLSYDYSMKPFSMTIGYSTSTTMVVRYVTTKEQLLGKLSDDITNTIFNWRLDEYQSLGRINNRIFLMRIKV